MNNHLIYIIAGEKSGDKHGAALISALKELDSGLQFKGIGGDHMTAEGLKALLSFKDFQVMGFSDIVRAYPRLRRHFYTILETILSDNPKAVVFVDYPGFNLRLAKALRKKGYKGKLVHYIAPTVWAWGKSRVKSMQETLDLLLTIYPFESSYFPNLRTQYVGNPLIEALKKQPPSFDIEQPFIALFPGSRANEIVRNLPLEIAAAEIFQKSHPEFGFAVSLSQPSLKGEIENQLKKSSLRKFWIVPEEYRYSLMQKAQAALAKSGTVTLELALSGCPTVVLYQLTRLNYFLAKYIFRVQLPHYALPNILLQERLFPEWYAVKISPQLLADALSDQLGRDIKPKSQALQKLLTEQNASQTAARAINEILT